MDDSHDLKQVKIAESSQQSSSIKNNRICKLILIPLAVILIFITIIYIFKNVIKVKKFSDSTHYDYLIVGSGLYGATFNY